MTLVPNTASDFDQWNLILAVVVPFIVAVIHQPRFSPWARVLVVVVVCVVASLVNTSLQGDLHMSNWLHSFIVVLAGALFLYRTLFAKVAPAVEARTNVGTRPSPGPRG